MTVVVVDAVALLIVLCFWLLPSDARFSVDAKTEVATLTIPKGKRLPDWGELRPVGLTDTDDGKPCADPVVRLAPIVKQNVVMGFHIRKGGLETTVDGQGGSLGTLRCGAEGETEERAAPDYLVFQWPVDGGSPPTLRYAGLLTIGEEVNDNGTTASILVEGRIDAEARSWPFESGAARSTTELLPGDQIQFFKDGSTAAISYGVIRPQDELIRVIASSKGQNVQLLRAGQRQSEPVLIAPSFVARLQAQAEWAIIGVMGTILLNLLGALAEIASLSREER